MHRGRAVVARGLQMRTRRGDVFSNVDIDAPTGSVIAVVGPTGSGKTALLLAIAGRMRPTAGSLEVFGLSLPRHARDVRSKVALGVVGGVSELDDALTVSDQMRIEMLLGRRAYTAAAANALLARADCDVSLNDGVSSLDALQKMRLGLALALSAKPEMVVIDDVDHDLTQWQREAFARTLTAIAAEQITVVTACIDRHHASFADIVVDLAPQTHDANALEVA